MVSAATCACCAVVRLSSVALLLASSLFSEVFCAASCARICAMPCSVRCRCSLTDASVWAAVRNWVASSLCVPATSRTSDAWESALGRIARAEQAEDRGLVGVLVHRDRHRGELGAGGVVARLRVGRLLLHLGEPGLRRAVLLVVGVVLLADLVHLGLQAVYLRLNLADGRRGGGPGPGGAGVDGEAGRGGDGDREDGAAPDLGCAGKVLGRKALSHDAVTLRSPCLADKPEAGDHGSEGNGRISTGSRKPHEMITDSSRECGAVSDVVVVYGRRASTIS